MQNKLFILPLSGQNGWLSDMLTRNVYFLTYELEQIVLAGPPQAKTFSIFKEFNLKLQPIYVNDI